jgi:hypothetical protein
MTVTQHQPRRTGMRLGLWAVILLGVFAWAPATHPGYWQGLEGFVPVFNATQTSPLANIATTPDLWRGIGNDAFLLARPLLLMGLHPTAAVRITMIVALILGGLGIYIWLRPHLGDRAAGLSGLLYMLLPSSLATVYVRGSISDVLILGLLPMALAGVTIHATTRSRSAVFVTVIAVVWMWRTQAGLALLATILLLLYAILIERRWWSWPAVVVSGVAGAISLWPIWSVHASPAVVFQDHFVYLFQLFGNGWQTAPTGALVGPGWQDNYPFQLGYAAVSFSIISLWLWQRRGRIAVEPAMRRLLSFSFIGVAILIALSLEISAPLWQWTRGDSLLTYPWQVLLMAGPLLAVTAGSLPALYQDLGYLPYWVVLLALVTLSSYSYLSADFTQVEAPPSPVAEFGARHDLIILDAVLTEHPESHAAELAITWQTLRPLTFDCNIFLQAAIGGDGAPTVVAQLDTQPLNGERPATSWRPGEILSETYRLDLASVPAGNELRYFFGYYDWRNGQRLPLDGGLDDKLVFYGR